MYRRKRYNRKRGYRPRKYTAYRVYKTLNKKVNEINKKNRPEMRTADTVGTSEDIYTTGTMDLVTTTGTAGEYQYIHSIQLKGILELDTDQAADAAIARIIVFIDRRNTDPDNDSIVWTKVWKTETVYSIRAVTDGTGPIVDRYKILYDRTFSLSKDADGYSKSKRLVKWYKKFKKPIKSCKGTTSQGGHVNSIYIAYIATTATTVMDFDYQIRCRYTEDND